MKLGCNLLYLIITKFPTEKTEKSRVLSFRVRFNLINNGIEKTTKTDLDPCK